jgi:hypothetical protein
VSAPFTFCLFFFFFKKKKKIEYNLQTWDQVGPHIFFIKRGGCALLLLHMNEGNAPRVVIRFAQQGERERERERGQKEEDGSKWVCLSPVILLHFAFFCAMFRCDKMSN